MRVNSNMSADLVVVTLLLLLFAGVSVHSFHIQQHRRHGKVSPGCHMMMTGGEGNEPVSPRDRFNQMGLRMGAAAALAVGGKIVSDGPVFSETISMIGKTVAITGANTGLGKEAAVKLAALGANVILLCRNMAAADEARAEIEQRSGSRRVSCLSLDLASIKSIESCVTQLKSQVPNVDVLMNNAGVMAIPTREVTSDGFEKQMGINHLGHFVLTSLMMKAGLIRAASSGGTARIINVSSAAHFFGDLEKARADDDLMLAHPSAYAPWVACKFPSSLSALLCGDADWNLIVMPSTADCTHFDATHSRSTYMYLSTNPPDGNSKLANILFTSELDKRLNLANNPSNIASFSLHPGGCRTELGRYIFDPNSVPAYLYPVAGLAAAPLVYFTKSAEQGAQTQIYLAASNELDLARNSGKYFDNSRVAATSEAATNAETASWLWSESERITGIKF